MKAEMKWKNEGQRLVVKVIDWELTEQDPGSSWDQDWIG